MKKFLISVFTIFIFVAFTFTGCAVSGGKDKDDTANSDPTQPPVQQNPTPDTNPDTTNPNTTNPDTPNTDTHNPTPTPTPAPTPNPDPTPTPEPEKPDSSSVLIVYFSATGNTKPLAQYAASYTGGTLYEIEAKVPYTADDLKYYTNCRADREQNDPTARPEIKGTVADMVSYKTVFIGYPIWHGQAPKIIYTFLESYNFSGKTVVPFCTSASSGVGSSATNLHAHAPNAVWKEGKRFAIGTDEGTVKSWIDGLNLNIKEEIVEEEISMVKVHCGSKVLDIELADNPSAKAFAQKLKEGDVTVKMNDYGDFEKVGSLGFSLVQTDTQITTSPGDVILYLGNSITIYYDQNSWNFTRLGKIKGMTRETMLAFFGGKGEVSVTFSLK